MHCTLLTLLEKVIVGAVLHSLDRNKLPGETTLSPYFTMGCMIGLKSGISGVEPSARFTAESEAFSSSKLNSAVMIACCLIKGSDLYVKMRSSSDILGWNELYVCRMQSWNLLTGGRMGVPSPT